MEQPIISSRLLFVSLSLGAIVLLIILAGNLFSTNTKIVACNNEGVLTVYMRLNNKYDLLVNPKSLKSALSCIGRYMPFYDRTIEFLLVDSKKDLLKEELKDRYNMINTTSSTNVNLQTLGKIRYDNKYVEFEQAKRTYLIVLEELSPFDLNKKLKSKDYSLIFLPEYSQKYFNLTRKINNKKIEVPTNSNYVYFLSTTL